MPPKRSLTRKRQTKLTFSPLPSSSPGAAALSPQVRSRAATVAVESSPSSRPAKRRKVVPLSDSDTEIGLPTPKKSFQSNIGTPSKRETDRGIALSMPASTQKRGMFGSSDNEIDLSSSTSTSETKKSPRPKKKGATRLQKAQKPLPESESSDSDVMPDTSPPRRVRRAVTGRRHQRRRQRSNSFEVPDDEVVEESEDEVVPRSTQRRKAPRQPTESEEGENSEEDKAGRRRGPRKHSRQEEEDLEEDLNFLQSSPPPDKGRLRSTHEKPLNERQKALAALKRKRAKAGSSTEPSSSMTPGRRRAIILDESESDLEIIEEEKASEVDDLLEQDDEIDDEESDDEQTSSGHHIKALDVFYENADDADFLDDEEDGLIGEPTEDASIPLQFTALSRAKPRELFKFAIDWMVQKKINPAFASNNEIYELTFRKLNDEVAALANSKYSSSVWRPDFIRALRARPDIEISEIGRLERSIGEAHCEACNRKSHPASFSIAFVGKPYNKDTLEPLVEETDSESGSDSDSDSDISSTGSSEVNNNEKPTYDEQGEIIPPDSHVFTVGSHCKANAQMAHTLHHWRHHLYSWVVDYLIREGHCTPEKLVERDRWSQRKREKYAKRIVKKMDKIGEIKKLHHLYKEQVEFALEARNEYKSGWGRS